MPDSVDSSLSKKKLNAGSPLWLRGPAASVLESARLITVDSGKTVGHPVFHEKAKGSARNGIAASTAATHTVSTTSTVGETIADTTDNLQRLSTNLLVASTRTLVRIKWLLSYGRYRTLRSAVLFAHTFVADFKFWLRVCGWYCGGRALWMESGVRCCV